MSGQHATGNRAHTGVPGLIPGWDTAPGGPRAVAEGCLCSVLANAAYRARADLEPIIDPRCPVHTAAPPPPPAAPTS